MVKHTCNPTIPVVQAGGCYKFKARLGYRVNQYFFNQENKGKGKMSFMKTNACISSTVPLAAVRKEDRNSVWLAPGNGVLPVFRELF